MPLCKPNLDMFLQQPPKHSRVSRAAYLVRAPAACAAAAAATTSAAATAATYSSAWLAASAALLIPQVPSVLPRDAQLHVLCAVLHGILALRKVAATMSKQIRGMVDAFGGNYAPATGLEAGAQLPTELAPETKNRAASGRHDMKFGTLDVLHCKFLRKEALTSRHRTY